MRRRARCPAGEGWILSGIVRAVVGHSAFRYLLVGGFAFLLDLGLLTLAYRVLGAPLWVATAFGFWGSFAFNFTLQRRFAFDGAMPTGPALWRYCVLLGVNSLANILVVGLFERLAWGYAFGKVTVTVAQTVWNYFAYKHWVFVDQRTAPATEAVDGAAAPVQHQHKEI